MAEFFSFGFFDPENMVHIDMQQLTANRANLRC